MSILGTLLGTAVSAIQQVGQNAFAASEAEKNRQFQSSEAQLAYERTLQADSTKYQRQVEDMKAAGINPMMAVSSGAGSVQASPASGSQASASSVGNLGSLILQGEQLKIQKELADAEVRNKDADTAKKESETEGNHLQNQFFRDTADLKAALLGDEHDRNAWEKEIGLRGVAVKEANQAMLEEQANHYNDYLDAMADLIGEQKVSEELKRQLYRANAKESSMNAAYKAAMLEVDKQAKEGATEESRANAELLRTEARIKNGIYTPQYIMAICKDLDAEE